MKKIFIYIIIGVFALLSCGPSVEEQRRISREERARLHREDSLALKVAVMPTLDCLPVFVAKELHLTDTLGLDMRPKMFNAQMDCDTAFVGSTAEMAFTDLVRTEKLIKNGTPVRYLSATTLSWQFITNRTTRVKEAKQLGDKMVAMTRYSATDYLTDYILHDVKTTAPAYKIQINDITVRLHMLQNNEMDALWLPEPQATVARQLKHTVVFDTRKEDIWLGVIAVNKRRTGDAYRQKQINLFVKAYNNACDSINKNGMKHYSDILKTIYKLDDKTIDLLPKTVFKHISEPRNEDVVRAIKYIN